MRQRLCHARVLTDTGFRDDLEVDIEAGRILRVATAASGPAPRRVIDLDGGYLVPGFIDCQVNGGGGVLFNNTPTLEGVRAIAAAHRRYGTTGLLPTLISDDAATMRAAVEAVSAAIRSGVPGVLGIHLEGPYLSEQRKGTHDAVHFRVPDADELALVTSLSPGITLVTLAPERLPIEVIPALVERGVVVCIGHSAATYEQACAALRQGARGFTHLYNAMSPLQSREPGVVGAALADAESACGVIVDGHHVHAGALRVALAAKPRGTVFLVTDAMPPVGADDPSFELYGEKITAVDGLCRNAAGALAGSALDMASAVRNTVHLLGVPLDEAVRMASAYPARLLGLDDARGRIAPGFVADLAWLDEDLRVRGTWIAGEAELLTTADG